MLIVVELYVDALFDPDAFLSEEARRETEARVVTRTEAAKLGLSGLPEPDPERGETRYVLVNARHRRWIERAAEGDPHVSAFNVYDIGG